MVLSALVAAALLQGAATNVSVTNGTSEQLICGVKKVGSASFETVTLRPGQSWTRTYDDASQRRFRCQTPMASWHTLMGGRQYKLVKNSGGLVVIRPATR